MSDDQNERLQNEISLLEAMYSDQIAFYQHTRELKYANEEGSFTLRIPDGYLHKQIPEVLSASIRKSDRREQLRERVKALEVGEEVLDAIVTEFNYLIPEENARETNETETLQYSRWADSEPTKKATVVVWLHHLLNTNKRKQALSPSSSEVSGITKPGYPGVLVYTGPSEAVHEHVNELKSLNWQAFQIRLETEDEWTLNHGHGVKEVESMKDVVNAIDSSNKDTFMEAMRMK